MSRLLIPAIGALALAAFGVPASAQVLGGSVTGGVSGNVGVQTPPLGQATGVAQDAVRGAGQMTRDTVGDARGAVQNRTPSAQVDTGVQGHMSADSAQAGAEGQVSVGAMVHGSDGRMLGEVVDVARDSAGRVEGYVVRTADGARRTLPAASASVQGGAVVASDSDLR